MHNKPLQCSGRLHAALVVSASQLRPPLTRRPGPGNDQSPKRNFSTQQRPGSQAAPSRSLRDAAEQARGVWQRIKPQKVKQVSLRSAGSVCALAFLCLECWLILRNSTRLAQLLRQSQGRCHCRGCHPHIICVLADLAWNKLQQDDIFLNLWHT